MKVYHSNSKYSISSSVSKIGPNRHLNWLNQEQITISAHGFFNFFLFPPVQPQFNRKNQEPELSLVRPPVRFLKVRSLFRIGSTRLQSVNSNQIENRINQNVPPIRFGSVRFWCLTEDEGKKAKMSLLMSELKMKVYDKIKNSLKS